MTRKFSTEQTEYFKTLLSYEQDTGIFRWKESRNSFGGKAKAGEIAGTISDGYVLIGIDGQQYRAHILAWWFVKGEDVPAGQDIDHENRVRSDNRWVNLRPLRRSHNNHNSDPHKSNKSGVKGVSWAKRDNKWDARIKLDGKVHTLGRFDNFSDAVEARLKAEAELLGHVMSAKGIVPDAPVYEPERTAPAEWSEQERAEFRRNRSLTPRRTNTSGCAGVRLHKASGLWHARIVVKYKEISLGYFKTIDEAILARKSAEEKYLG